MLLLFVCLFLIDILANLGSLARGLSSHTAEGSLVAWWQCFRSRYTRRLSWESAKCCISSLTEDTASTIQNAKDSRGVPRGTSGFVLWGRPCCPVGSAAFRSPPHVQTRAARPIPRCLSSSRRPRASLVRQNNARLTGGLELTVPGLGVGLLLLRTVPAAPFRPGTVCLRLNKVGVEYRRANTSSTPRAPRSPQAMGGKAPRAHEAAPRSPEGAPPRAPPRHDTAAPAPPPPQEGRAVRARLRRRAGLAGGGGDSGSELLERATVRKAVATGALGTEGRRHGFARISSRGRAAGGGRRDLSGARWAPGSGAAMLRKGLPADRWRPPSSHR